jgi:GR25 family glycosyltransferase involved in LPS biosynthesis
MKNFIICLSEIPASLKTATDLKTQLIEYGEDVELFEGTYGNEAVKMMENEGRTHHPWGIKGPPSKIENYEEKAAEWRQHKSEKASTPGVKGCFYSHYNLWKKCVELNEPIIIWEDDIVLRRKYIPIEWDDVLILALGHPTKSVRYLPYLESPEGEPVASYYKNSSMPGCCGYAIKPHAAKKLLDVYEKTYLPADNAISVYHVKIQIHNYIMGKALIKADGKKSLTRTEFWNSLK